MSDEETSTRNGQEVGLPHVVLLALKCPQCGSEEVLELHHDGTFASPECDYYECDDCGEQWGHC